MKVIRKHFEGKTTILIHDRIINGCQDFTMEETPDILKKYNVSDDCWKQVTDIYTGVSSDDEISSFLDDEDCDVREAVAIHGNNQHRDRLVDDEDWRVRAAVAIHGNDQHRDQLVDDKDWYVRGAVAIHGNNQHRDRLIDDKDWLVRRAVARYKS